MTTTLNDWQTWPAAQKRALLERIRDERARRIRGSWVPYPWQRPHHHPTTWRGTCGPACMDLPPLPPIPAHGMWLMMGGRGTGKTDGCAEYVLRHVEGPACDPRAPGGHRIAIVAPTQGDAIEACVTGMSGLQAHDPRVRLVGTRGGTFALFANGARARLFGAHTPDDVNRLRAGGNNCLVWLEEAAAQRRLGDVLDHSAFGLRVGPAPHWVVSTTPRVRPEVKAWLADPSVHVTRGRTADATHLDARVRAKLEAKFAGTRKGREEMDGELLDDIDGALWKHAMIDASRLSPAKVEPYRRIVVGVDPNAGGTDDVGIVVAGVTRALYPDSTGREVSHVHVLEDASGHFTGPESWARAVVAAYRRWNADCVVAEVNNGGDMVVSVMRNVDTNLPVRSVHASRGKVLRAEPVTMLYEQERVHHLGVFPVLEDQMTGWVDGVSTYSPDNMDALVWAITDLLDLATTGSTPDIAEI